MKVQSAESQLKLLIKKNDRIHNILLIERILKIIEITNNDILENPKDWEKSFISPNLFNQLSKNVSETLKS